MLFRSGLFAKGGDKQPCAIGNSCDREFLLRILSDFSLFVSSSIYVVYQDRIDEASEGEVMVLSKSFVNERPFCF